LTGAFRLSTKSADGSSCRDTAEDNREHGAMPWLPPQL